MKGKRRSDYDISFRRSINQLSTEKLSTLELKIEIDRMIETYFEDTGDMPESSFLDSLADIILNEDTKERNSILTVGIMSERQYTRRINKENQSYEDLRDEELSEIDQYDDSYETETHPKITHIYGIEITTRKSDIKSNKVVISRIKPCPNPKGVNPDDLRRIWAQSVKKRDGYRCQNHSCRSRNGIMHAHHIKNFADYPELRFEVDNGITLCESCHTYFHSLYGKKRNNQEQLKEFLKLFAAR